jgi:hypothetical protein
MIVPDGIRLSLSGTPASAPRCIVIDQTGRKVASLDLSSSVHGRWQGVWNGGACPAGVYFFLVEGRNGRATAKALLLKGGGQ